MMPNSSPVYLEVENIFAIGAEQQSRRKSTAGLKDPLNYTNRAIVTFVDAVSKMNEAVLVPSRLRDIEVREIDANDLMTNNSDLYSYYQMLNTAKQDLFSSVSYQTAFQPGVGATGSNNSGASSGRVTPTTLSRRSSMYGGGPGFGGSSSPNGLNGTSSPRSLMPPSMFERKLSGQFENGINNNGSSSPDRDLQQQVSSLLPGVGGGLTVPLTYGINRPPSLNNLLVTAGLDVPEGEVVAIEERVSSISACFMHHLTALYTILGHFTRAANYITRRYQEETEDAALLGN